MEALKGSVGVSLTRRVKGLTVAGVDASQSGGWDKVVGLYQGGTPPSRRPGPCVSRIGVGSGWIRLDQALHFVPLNGLWLAEVVFSFCVVPVPWLENLGTCNEISLCERVCERV